MYVKTQRLELKPICRADLEALTDTTVGQTYIVRILPIRWKQRDWPKG